MRVTRAIQSERGVALILSIVGLVVIGALVTGVVASGISEHRMGDNTRRMTQAFSAAEHGLSETIAGWNAATLNFMPVGTSEDVAGATPGGTGAYAGQVHRLNDQLFLVEIVGRDAGARARQRVGAFVKLVVPTFDIRAALTTRGDARLGGTAEVNGEDHVPWAACPLPGPTESGVRTLDPDRLTLIGGCAGAECITGDPKIEHDPTISDATFFDYGELTWDDLVGRADKVLTGSNYQNILPSTTADGECDASDVRNWGEPWEPTATPACSDYFPIIYATGTLQVNTGRGQGVLLVEGDLEANGHFAFFGPVVVRGRLQTAGSGNHFMGGVLAANVELDDTSVLGNAVVTFSRCAIQRAVLSAAPGTMLRSRGWMQVY